MKTTEYETDKKKEADTVQIVLCHASFSVREEGFYGEQNKGREGSVGGFGNMPQMNIPSMPNQENNSQSDTPTEPDK